MKFHSQLCFSIVVTCFSFACSVSAFAEPLTTTCKQGKNIRKIEIAPGDAESPNGCSVAYFKETENPGVTQVLWSAKNDNGFCKEKAEAFIKKLQGMSWECSGPLSGAEVKP